MLYYTCVIILHWCNIFCY